MEVSHRSASFSLGQLSTLLSRWQGPLAGGSGGQGPLSGGMPRDRVRPFCALRVFRFLAEGWGQGLYP